MTFPQSSDQCTFTAQLRSEPNSKPIFDLYRQMNDEPRERRSIGFLSRRKEAKGTYKRQRRINDANCVYRKKKQKTLTGVITNTEYGKKSLRADFISAFTVGLVADGPSCRLNIDLLVGNTHFGDVGHFRASQL